jgi:hypothetical protein
MKTLAYSLGCAWMLILCATWPGSWRANASQSPASAVKPPIYVYDFELDVAPPGSPTQVSGQDLPSNVTSTAAMLFPNQQPRKKPVNPEEEKRKHASELVNWMSASLIAELQKAGYSANRVHAGERPGSGVAIRGIFTEIDPQNHWRRAVIRSADDSGKMQAVVSVANLAKPEQAMYEIAPLPGNEAKPGAVITLSPYVPLTKYDLDKKADQPALQAIAARMVKDLTALLATNPAAFTQ